MKKEKIDIKENDILSENPEILKILLLDRTTKKNIIWATNDYIPYGDGYSFSDEITIEKITFDNGDIIKPRVQKDKLSQAIRSKDKAEVFTPSWVCNVQNNLIDNAWFGNETKRFNKELDKSWDTEYKKVKFPKKSGKNWMDYVLANRLEISCGEAPYLASRYDTVTGKPIAIGRRVGLLDRKLRVVGENVDDYRTWLKWAKKALQSVYGFEYQGDNVLLARENLLATMNDYYFEKFKKPLPAKAKEDCANIISWNIWQMDGLTYYIPGDNKEQVDFDDFLKNEQDKIVTLCIIKDWQENKELFFKDLVGASYGEI